jgi:Immunity protein family (Imm11)
VYYVWETRRRRETEVVVPQFALTMKEHKVSFIAGRRFRRPLPELEMHFSAEGEFVLTDDLVIRRRRCLVHSPRLIDVLRRAGVDSIDYYPCRLVNDATGAVYRTHQAANLLDVIYCLDREQSELDIDDEEPNEIWSIDRLKLIEDRLGDSLMFRLGERRNTVVVHQRVKEAVERAGLDGPVFLPADGYREWPGYSLDNPRNVVGTHDLDPDGPADRTEDDEDESVPVDQV